MSKTKKFKGMLRNGGIQDYQDLTKTQELVKSPQINHKFNLSQETSSVGRDKARYLELKEDQGNQNEIFGLSFRLPSNWMWLTRRFGLGLVTVVSAATVDVQRRPTFMHMFSQRHSHSGDVKIVVFTR
jgi:hypothetical protein